MTETPPLTQQQWIDMFESLRRYTLSLIFLERGDWDKRESLSDFICRQYVRCKYLSGNTLIMHRSMFEPALQILNAKTFAELPYIRFTVNGTEQPLPEGCTTVLLRVDVPTMACYRRVLGTPVTG